MTFRIYYGDETVWEGDSPEDVPTNKREDVQCIVWPDPDQTSPQSLGRHVLQAWDFYLYSDRVGGWHVTNRTHDLLFHIRDQGLGPGGVRAILTGGWVANDVFARILENATKGDDWSVRRSAVPKYNTDGMDT